MSATLLSYILVIFFGLTFLESAGTRKIFSLVRYVLTVPFLIIAGKVLFSYVLVMFVASGIGAHIGCYYADKIRNKRMRILFVVVTLIAVISMFF